MHRILGSWKHALVWLQQQRDACRRCSRHWTLRSQIVTPALLLANMLETSWPAPCCPAGSPGERPLCAGGGAPALPYPAGGVAGVSLGGCRRAAATGRASQPALSRSAGPGGKQRSEAARLRPASSVGRRLVTNQRLHARGTSLANSTLEWSCWTTQHKPGACTPTTRVHRGCAVAEVFVRRGAKAGRPKAAAERQSDNIRCASEII